jgi:hypothetical protein
MMFHTNEWVYNGRESTSYHTLGGVSVAGSHLLYLLLHRFGWCFNDILTMIAALGPHTRA